MAKAATQAVATREPDTRPAPVRLAGMFDNRLPAIVELMGDQKKAEAFVRVVKNAILRDPQIADADQQSVFLECQKAAQDGLLLDGREAVLTRYNLKASGNMPAKTVVVYVPMIAGIKKRVRNSGEITGWNFGLVYANEVRGKTEDGQPRFRYWRDDAGNHLIHQPIIPAVDGERGDLVLVYSAARLKDGSADYEVMDIDDVKRIQARSRSGDKGPWASDFGEMAKKTVGKRHAKNLPLSSDDMRVMDRDNDLYDYKREAGSDVFTDAGSTPKSVSNKRGQSVADKLAAARAASKAEPEPEPQREQDEEEQTDDQGHDDPGSKTIDATPNPGDAF